MKISNQNKLLFIFSLISIVILTFLFKKLLFGSYSFIGPDSLSSQRFFKTGKRWCKLWPSIGPT